MKYFWFLLFCWCATAGVISGTVNDYLWVFIDACAAGYAWHSMWKIIDRDKEKKDELSRQKD